MCEGKGAPLSVSMFSSDSWLQAVQKGKSLSQLHTLSIQILSEHLKSMGIMNKHNNVRHFLFFLFEIL